MSGGVPWGTIVAKSTETAKTPFLASFLVFVSNQLMNERILAVNYMHTCVYYAF